jgi:hypothetical protein
MQQWLERRSFAIVCYCWDDGVGIGREDQRSRGRTKEEETFILCLLFEAAGVALKSEKMHVRNLDLPEVSRSDLEQGRKERSFSFQKHKIEVLVRSSTQRCCGGVLRTIESLSSRSKEGTAGRKSLFRKKEEKKENKTNKWQLSKVQVLELI